LFERVLLIWTTSLSYLRDTIFLERDISKDYIYFIHYFISVWTFERPTLIEHLNMAAWITKFQNSCAPPSTLLELSTCYLNNILSDEKKLIGLSRLSYKFSLKLHTLTLKSIISLERWWAISIIIEPCLSSEILF